MARPSANDIYLSRPHKKVLSATGCCLPLLSLHPHSLSHCDCNTATHSLPGSRSLTLTCSCSRAAAAVWTTLGGHSARGVVDTVDVQLLNIVPWGVRIFTSAGTFSPLLLLLLLGVLPLRPHNRAVLPVRLEDGLWRSVCAVVLLMWHRIYRACVAYMTVVWHRWQWHGPQYRIESCCKMSECALCQFSECKMGAMSNPCSSLLPNAQCPMDVVCSAGGLTS